MLIVYNSAAFGRLCVETIVSMVPEDVIFSAAFGRLCVETTKYYQRS